MKRIAGKEYGAISQFVFMIGQLPHNRRLWICTRGALSNLKLLAVEAESFLKENSTGKLPVILINDFLPDSF